MPRPQLAAYTVGTINTKAIGPKQFQARAYYRDRHDVRKQVSATGASVSAAEAALKAKVREAEATYRGGTSGLNERSTVEQAAAAWLAYKRTERKSNGQPIKQRTLDDYAGYIDRVIKGYPIGAMPLAKANSVGVIEDWLADIASTRGAVAAKQSRKVLGGILSLAERRDAIPASVMRRVKLPGPAQGSTGDRVCRVENCDGTCAPHVRHLKTDRAFTRDEVAAVLAAADASRADIGDLAAFLFATGVRISEALTCTAWADVDLDAATVRVRGTKTARADRVLSMPADLVERLRARAQAHGTKGLVFGYRPSDRGRGRHAGVDRTGKPRDLHNVLDALRTVFRAAGVPWAGSHTFRRTVATWMDESGAPLSEIANQLGHGDVTVTAGYLGRTTQPTRAASVMSLAAPA